MKLNPLTAIPHCPHGPSFERRNVDVTTGIASRAPILIGIGRPNYRIRPFHRYRSGTCRARRSGSHFGHREPPPHTRAPDDKPPARTSNSARTALLKVRISRRWYDSRPSSLRCCRSSTSARRRWPKASARQIPSELDDQHPPSREDRPSDVLADLWYQKAPIDARDDVQSTVVRLDVVPCLADHHFRRGNQSTATEHRLGLRRLATSSTAPINRRAHGGHSQALSCCRSATIPGAGVRT